MQLSPSTALEICRLIDLFLSNVSIKSSRHLRTLHSQDPVAAVPLHVFARLRCISKLAPSMEILTEALRSSPDFRVSADGLHVSRITPYSGDDVDLTAHSVWASGFPSWWTFEDARLFFSAHSLTLVGSTAAGKLSSAPRVATALATPCTTPSSSDTDAIKRTRPPRMLVESLDSGDLSDDNSLDDTWTDENPRDADTEFPIPTAAVVVSRPRWLIFATPEDAARAVASHFLVSATREHAPDGPDAAMMLPVTLVSKTERRAASTAAVSAPSRRKTGLGPEPESSEDSDEAPVTESTVRAAAACPAAEGLLADGLNDAVSTISTLPPQQQPPSQSLS